MMTNKDQSMAHENAKKEEGKDKGIPQNLTQTNETKQSILQLYDSENIAVSVKLGLSAMMKGGVIMDVTNVDDAIIAQASGATAVMALEAVPADIRRDGGVCRMSDPAMIRDIMNAVTIPVMAKCRIGHTTEAQILSAMGVDFIDESEVLTPADASKHIHKKIIKSPFVCGCRNLGEALRRIEEGAVMIRTKGEAGTGNVASAVHHIRTLHEDISKLENMSYSDLVLHAKNMGVSPEILRYVQQAKRLPVVNFAAGGIATPADAALCMQLGVDGVFVGSGIFRSSDPEARARAIVQAVTYYTDPHTLLSVSTGLGKPMIGVNDQEMKQRWEHRESGTKTTLTQSMSRRYNPS